MTLADIVKQAQRRIVICGVSPIARDLEGQGDILANLLNLNRELSLAIIYESDSECFQQSLCVDTPFSVNRQSYASLTTHRNRISGPPHGRRSRRDLGLLERIETSYSRMTRGGKVKERILVKQQNLRMPFCSLAVDDTILLALVTNVMPTLDDYCPLEKGSPLYAQVKSYLDFSLDETEGGVYLSDPSEELIQLYDREGFPRGIYPRACFYTTSFKRFSIWGFVFNRKGQLLLHQRSQTTKDGRGLWDKSTGGHVDLRDYSTFRTAQRELIEELFLPEAEFSKYIQAYLRDIVNFGDWNPVKRLEKSFAQAFAGLEPQDWILFRAMDENGDPLTVDRISKRRIHDGDNVVIKDTVFMSDVFFFIAPEGYLDTEQQMAKTFSLAEKRGAAQAHKLVSVTELRDWIAVERQRGTEYEVFTEDLLYIDDQYRGLLERFCEFVRFVFPGEGR